jgi:hypothetical protein
MSEIQKSKRGKTFFQVKMAEKEVFRTKTGSQEVERQVV